MEGIDLDRLLKHAKQSASFQSIAPLKLDTIDALPIETLQSIEKKRNHLYELGISQLKGQKLAVVLLSGGQGSRLGFNHAKGMFDIGITRSISIFEILLQNLSRLMAEIGAPIPLFIMTSYENHNEVQQFFRQHGSFGYPQQYIEFFVQSEFPALDSDGNIYLTQDNEPLMLPNGNGGWYDALVRSGILDKPQYSSVEWINVVAVDNPLQNMADPVFLGATIASSFHAGAKVIRKATPEEKVGIICKIKGRPQIIEYYDLPDSVRYEKTAAGEYKYQYGVTLNYLFHKTTLAACQKHELPLHYVSKSVRVDSDNCIMLKKVETLILDMIAFCDSVCAYEIVREKEFAPVKNATGTDSVETARVLLQKR